MRKLVNSKKGAENLANDMKEKTDLNASDDISREPEPEPEPVERLTEKIEALHLPEKLEDPVELKITEEKIKEVQENFENNSQLENGVSFKDKLKENLDSNPQTQPFSNTEKASF